MSVDGWAHLGGRAPRTVEAGGMTIGRGSRVVLRPRDGRDIFDIALAGRVAVIESIEEQVDGGHLLAVVLEDDPGRDLGVARQPGHRFFYAPDEVEPLAEQPPGAAASTRILVAGIGNIFLGDDGFGVELARRLAERPLPGGVDVVDYGIRGMDLAYDLAGGDWDAAVLLDAVPRGEAPGTLYVIEPEVEEGDAAVEAHAMNPVSVLLLARTLGAPARRTLVVGCEPQTVVELEAADPLVELSPPVLAALDGAVALVESLLQDLTTQTAGEETAS
jgi:hydrogenase maturation protease